MNSLLEIGIVVFGIVFWNSVLSRLLLTKYLVLLLIFPPFVIHVGYLTVKEPPTK